MRVPPESVPVTKSSVTAVIVPSDPSVVFVIKYGDCQYGILRIERLQLIGNAFEILLMLAPRKGEEVYLIE